MLSREEIERIAEEIVKSNVWTQDSQHTISPTDPDGMGRMRTKTTARIGVGRAGPRLRTSTMLKLRADHAAARDAVLMDVSEETIQRLGLFPVITKCRDKEMFLTRPDLGRDFDEAARELIVKNCMKDPEIQLIVSDGLS